MKSLLTKLVFCCALLCLCDNTSAQGFFKKLKQTAEKLITNSSQDEQSNDTINDKIKESDIPFYTCQKVYETDESGCRLKNDDGTDKYRVFLVDRSGNKVSSEVVAAQTKQINTAVITIATKVAIGAGFGAINGGSKGAIIGLAAGLGLSINDIQLIIKLKKNSNRQKKAIEVYQKSFDEEGNLIAANIDKETLTDLDISENNSTNESTSRIKEELSKPEYIATVKNESLDALLQAATKV